MELGRWTEDRGIYRVEIFTSWRRKLVKKFYLHDKIASFNCQKNHDVLIYVRVSIGPCQMSNYDKKIFWKYLNTDDLS